MTTCGGVVRTVRTAVTTIDANGEFAWSGTYVDDMLGDGDEDRQRLRLVGRREADGLLTGVWRGERDSYNGQAQTIDSTCSSGDVAFRVSPGGSTSQPTPQGDGSGHLVIALGERPNLVAVGAGRTWVRGQTATTSSADAPATTLTAIDPQTGHAATPLRLDDVTHDAKFAAGEGAAWLLKTGGPARLVRIDARTQRVVRGPRLATGPDSEFPEDLAVGGGGVWVLLAGRVVRADPRNGRVVRSIRVPADRRIAPQRRCTRPIFASLMTIHRDAVWVMSRTFLRCRSHASPRAFALARKTPLFSLMRIDARTNRVTRTVPLTREYSVLASGPSGVWGIACLKPLERYECRRPAVHRIDLRTGGSAVVVALPAAGPRLRSSQLDGAIGVGSGAVWIVQPADDPLPGSAQRLSLEPSGLLQRIDVTNPRLRTARAIPRFPADLAVDDHGAWLLDGFDRTLIRVRP